MPDATEIVVVEQRMDRAGLARLVRGGFGDMVKVVVDLSRAVAAVGGQLHADGEAELLGRGSQQADLWGANYYPGRGLEACVEYTALINIRPADDNPGMEISDAALRARVRQIVVALLGEGEPL